MKTHSENGEQADGSDEAANSLSLAGAVSLGTGVMIGAGIFAITGQTAALAGDLFPIAFLAAAAVVGVSAYSYGLGTAGGDRLVDQSRNARNYTARCWSAICVKPLPDAMSRLRWCGRRGR